MGANNTFFHEVAELFSLTLTFPCVVSALLVVWFWGPSAFQALKVLTKVRWWAEDAKGVGFAALWFHLGVVWGFGFENMDNGYWFIPWSMSYLDSSHTDTWMANGVFFNIPFRQLRGIASAYCHIRSAMCFDLTGNLTLEKLNHWLFWSTVVGILYSFTLWCAQS